MIWRTKVPCAQLLAVCLGLCLPLSTGCSVEVPVLLPPPFGPGKPPDAPRLFFPTGMAVARTGHLLIANGNFDHAFDSGTLVSMDPAWLASVFSDPNPLVRDEQIPSAAFTSAVLIGGYSGPIALDDDAFGGQNPVTTVYTASRDTNTLDAVQVDAAGLLSCKTLGGTDCRKGVIDLAAVDNLEAPFGIAAGFSRPPGAAADLPTIFVSALSPHIDEVVNGTAYTSAPVAAMDATDPTHILYSMLSSSSLLSVANGIGAGPMLFDRGRRTLILGGCYQRFPNSTQGTPSTGKCLIGAQPNYLRFMSVDSGADTTVHLIDISSQTRGNDVTGMVLGPEDASGRAHKLYVSVRSPDLLLEVTLTDEPGVVPFVSRATSLPISPAGIVRIALPPGVTEQGDLLAIAAAGNSAVDIFDGASGLIVSQIERLGTTPFSIVQLPPAAGDLNAHLIASVFADCRLAFIEMSYAQPWKTRLRGRLGSCPP